ncbi:penicillin-binding transpeptidase domain-containing protein [Salinicoccus sp. RF5]|uniref:penicillin-binding transpeptidase domain-containing protein n=1 Tax=Salinicoccus sp. RF5 TaxID=2748874 RepID=UPI001E4C80FB|nr:penicillin-binding transpeptidase domain-containing protein [Salinicoccus sp. RF5]MCC4722133.1 PASTA domain-containing protein [Salinicoccus sp. RF5]
MARIRIRLGEKTKTLSVGALLIYLGIGVLFLCIFWQFSYLMINKTLDDEDLVAHGHDKFSRTAVNEGQRGEILDREGNVLASDMEAYRLALITDSDYPNHVTDSKETAEALAAIIDMEASEIQERIEEGIEEERFQVELGKKGRDISYNQKNALEDAKIPGLVFEAETKRFYPNGDFASHLIGYAEKGEESDGLDGQLGLERAYDDLLQGEDGTTDYTQDLWGYIVPGTDTVEPPKDGADMKLTIDSNIQLYLEESLDTMEEHFEPEELFAVVADAESGEILASGQRPSFNPRTREGFGNSWLNMLYQHSFEPGSTFKVFGLAAAIDAGVYDPDATFESGSFDVNGHTIYDWEEEGWGNITYNEGMQYSSNALMMILQDKVGEDAMLDYYRKFGFGEPTGSEFPNEQSGTLAWDDPLQRKTTSFGQTSTVTPIQMIQGMTAILNDGKMKKPYVVESITDSATGEVLHKGEESVVRQVISEEAAQKTQEEINTFVGGSMERNPQYQLDDYEVAGKSGTAQVIDPEGGGYMDGPYEFLTSFIGYAPEDDPEVIVYYGVKLASKNKQDTWDIGVMPGFNPLMERTLKYLNVGGAEGEQSAEVTEVGDYSGKKLSEAAPASADTIQTIVVGDGEEIIDHHPKNDRLLPYETFFVKTEGEAKMPDLTGLSKREAIMFGTFMDMDVSTEGEGYVKSQSIAPGTVLGDEAAVEFTLSSNDPAD